MTAELLGDRGASAEDAEFFRSRPFLDAEGVTHTLRVTTGARTIAVPLLVREIPGSDALDATSPYGYPGATLAGEPAPPPRAEEIDWSGTGLVSIFARERVAGTPWLAAPRERSALQVHDPARPTGIRTRLAEQIRRTRRLGYEVEVIAGPLSSQAQQQDFGRVYGETMRRAGAAERYLYEGSYFERVLAFERSWLVLASTPAGALAAGAVVAASDGLLHYYLGGTGDEHLRDSPFKNAVHAMIELADELRMPLNLGGGVQPGDGLEGFKRGFANSELPFRTHEVVCDPERYARLGTGGGAPGFFPPYRSGG